MEEARSYPSGYIKRKPKVLLGKDFPFINNLKVGDKGQLDVKLVINRVAMVMDSDGNEIKEFTVEIANAELVKGQNDFSANSNRPNI